MPSLQAVFFIGENPLTRINNIDKLSRMRLQPIGEAFFNNPYGSFIRSPQGKWVRVTQARLDETFKNLLEQAYQERLAVENRTPA